MKGDSHIVRYSQPAAWTQPRDAFAICGHEMLDAVCVLDFQFPERSQLKPHICEGCQILYNLKRDDAVGREWFYGALPKAQADKLKNSDATGDF